MKIKISPEITFVISENEYNFKEVLQAIESSSKIFVATYNLDYFVKTSKIIKQIKKSNANTIIVSNIPENKKKIDDAQKKEAFNRYYESFREDFGLEHYINLDNHAKIILTDTCSYIGSANFSEGSKNSIEAGIIVTSSDISEQFWSELVPYYSSHESSIYLGDYNNLNAYCETTADYLVQLDRHLYELSMLKEKIYRTKFAERFGTIHELNEIDREYGDIEYSPNDFVSIHDLLLSIESGSWHDYYYALNGKIDSVVDEDDGYNHFYDSRCQVGQGSSLYSQAEAGEIELFNLNYFLRDLQRDKDYLYKVYLNIVDRRKKLSTITNWII